MRILIILSFLASCFKGNLKPMIESDNIESTIMKLLYSDEKIYNELVLEYLINDPDPDVLAPKIALSQKVRNDLKSEFSKNFLEIESFLKHVMDKVLDQLSKDKIANLNESLESRESKELLKIITHLRNHFNNNDFLLKLEKIQKNEFTQEALEFAKGIDQSISLSRNFTFLYISVQYSLIQSKLIEERGRIIGYYLYPFMFDQNKKFIQDIDNGISIPYVKFGLLYHLSEIQESEGAKLVEFLKGSKDVLWFYNLALKLLSEKFNEIRKANSKSVSGQI